MKRKFNPIAFGFVLTLGFSTLAGLSYVVIDSMDIVTAGVEVKQASVAQAGAQADSPREARKAQLEQFIGTDNGDVNAQLELAQILFAEQRYLQAANAFERVYALDPLNAEALYWTGISYYRAADYAQSEILLSDPKLTGYKDSGLYKARLMMVKNRLNDARQILQSEVQGYVEATTLLLADLDFIEQRYGEAEARYQTLLTTKEQGAAAHLGMAQIHQARGDSEQALVWLDRMPQGDASMQLDTARAELYRMLGQATRSIEIYQQLLAHYGPKTELILAKAELDAMSGDAALVRQGRDAITDTSAASLATIHYLNALISYLDKDYPQTLEKLELAEHWFSFRDLFQFVYLDAAVKAGSLEGFRHALTLIDLEQLSQRRKDYLYNQLVLGASDRLNQREGQLGKAVAEVAIKLTDQNSSAWLMLARAELLLGNFDQAVAVSQTPSLMAEFPAGALETAARAHIEAGDYPAARGLLEQLHALQPDSPLYDYWMGIAYFGESAYAQSEASLNRAFEAGASFKAGAALVDLYQATENWSGMERIAQHFIHQETAYLQGIGYAYLAGSERGQTHYEQAADHYIKAFERDSSRFLYLLSAFDLLIDANRLDRAQTLMDRLKELRPKDQIVRFKQAYLNQLYENTAAAIANYRQLLRDYPDWALVQLNLSELLAQDTVTQAESVAMARRASELAPQWSPAQLNLANLLNLTGNGKEALVFARRAAALDENSTDAKALVMQLAQLERAGE